MNRRRGWLARRYQVIVLDEHDGSTARRFRASPRAVIALALTLLLAGGFIGWLAGFQTRPPAATMDTEWKKTLQLARNQLAEMEAERRIRDAQITALKQELKRSGQQTEKLAQRIRIYESILDARKTTGVRILRASARWIPPGTISYDIVLVKGGNYPRSVAGTLRLIALGDHGRQAPPASNALELPYRMETHTFLRGNIAWKEAWRPVRLRIIRLNRRGEPRDQIDISIEEKSA